MNAAVPKVAVVTTFSEEGWSRYAERMVASFVKNWPAWVDLVVYPDEKVPLPNRVNVHCVDWEIKAKTDFIRRWGRDPAYRGVTDKGYNYRFDAVKFCHKPFALWHAAHEVLIPSGYSRLLWLDADTLTHAPVTREAVSLMAPREFDLQFLGRADKYSECGYLYFNLEGGPGVALLDNWIEYYTSGQFRREKEWHDSFLFDLARERTPHLHANDLTGHLPRRKGGGHPFINSFLGEYLDHLKGNSRKVTGRPRPGDLHTDHTATYWKENPHAKAPRKKPRATSGRGPAS